MAGGAAHVEAPTRDEPPATNVADVGFTLTVFDRKTSRERSKKTRLTVAHGPVT